MVSEASEEDIKAAFIIHGETCFGCSLTLFLELHHFIFPRCVSLIKRTQLGLCAQSN